MKIAFALAGSDRGRSGVGRYVEQVLPRLLARARARGDDVVALGTANDFAAYERLLGGVERRAVPLQADAPGPSAAWHLGLAGREARRAGADVLLLPAANRRVAWSSALPTVAVVHDLAQLHVPGKYDALRMLYVRRVVVAALARATALVAVSEATRAHLEAATGRRGDVLVVPNGVDAERFAAASPADAASARARVTGGAPYFLYLSRLEHPGKNHLRLLDAYARSAARATHRLVLVGADWGAAGEILSRAAQLGVAERVRWLGFAEDHELPGLVSGADALLMVGLCEGFGLPALEGLAAGRPIVASTTGAVLEATGPLAAPCDPYDPASIASALDRAAHDAALRERAAREGPAWARRFDWERVAGALLDRCAEVSR